MKFIVVFAALFFVACSSNDPYRKMGKLSGLWQMQTDDGILYEEWSKRNGDNMFGKSYMMRGSDSTVFERIAIAKTDSGVYYIPTVKDQNEDQAIYFKMISFENSIFTFENKRHDFPKRIIYRFVNNDSIVARLEGDNNSKGEMQVQQFLYSRVQK
jgi:hypothetical protein